MAHSDDDDSSLDDHPLSDDDGSSLDDHSLSDDDDSSLDDQPLSEDDGCSLDDQPLSDDDGAGADDLPLVVPLESVLLDGPAPDEEVPLELSAESPEDGPPLDATLLDGALLDRPPPLEAPPLDDDPLPDDPLELEPPEEDTELLADELGPDDEELAGLLGDEPDGGPLEEPPEELPEEDGPDDELLPEELPLELLEELPEELPDELPLELPDEEELPLGGQQSASFSYWDQYSIRASASLPKRTSVIRTMAPRPAGSNRQHDAPLVPLEGGHSASQHFICLLYTSPSPRDS